MGKATQLPFRFHTHRSGLVYIRFTHGGRPYDISTGTRNSLEALGRARAKYHGIVNGQVDVPKTAAIPILPLARAWTDQISGQSVDVDTARFYLGYARVWDAHFKDLHAIDTEAAQKYVFLRATRVMVSTIKKELAALRGFLQWCVYLGRLSVAPHIPAPDPRLRGVRANPSRKRTGQLLTPAQVEQVIRALPPFLRKFGGQQIPLRGYFTALYETGLRPVTLELLTVGRHYSVGAEELFITEDIDKNDYERRVPLTPAARKALDAASKGKVDGAPIFGRHEYRKALKLASEGVGLKGVTEYDFRHSRATHVLETSGNLMGTAFLLGHKQFTTTAKYAKPHEAAARDALKKMARKPRHS